MGNNLEEAKRFFGNDRYATEQTGIEILAAEKGYAKCELKIGERHKNAQGHVMGGVLFTLADYAFAIASNFEQPATVTQTSQIVFLASPKGSTLYAETELIRSGKSTCFYKIMISDDVGVQVAYVTATGFVVG